MGRRLLCFLICVAFLSSHILSAVATAQTGTKGLKKTEQLGKAPAPAHDKAKKAEVVTAKDLLPKATKAFFSITDINQLEQSFDETQIGQLVKNPEIKPFFESLKEQGADWLEEKNVRLGIRIEDLDEFNTGEVCIAGVLQDLKGGKPARGSHGLVLLVDVTGSEKAAGDLLKRVNARLVKDRAAQIAKMQINGLTVNKITINNPKRFRANQTSFQAISNGWMLTADNEEIFRDVLQRVVDPATIRPATTLASNVNFKSIMARTSLKGIAPSQLQWFVDPFGYIQLAQAIKKEETDKRQHKNDLARILQDQGLDAIRGIGGQFSMATGEHELLHRAYVFAPRENLNPNQKRIFDLFDFSSKANGPPVPARWVPANSAGFFSGNWNFTKLLSGVGIVFDAVMDEGDFERMISDFKTDPSMQLDIPKVVSMLGNEVTVVSATERPITESSERVVLGFRIKGDPTYVFESVKRGVGKGNGEIINLAGNKVIAVDTTKGVEIPELGGIDELELLNEIGEGGNEPEEELEEQREFELFEKRYFVIKEIKVKGKTVPYLLLSNEKNYLKKVLTSRAGIVLNETEDYIQVEKALAKLTNPNNVSLRQFGRMDRALETNYEMLRKNQMGKSQTVLARVLNRVFEKNNPEAAKAQRVQKIDGSKLPVNYSKSVAPFLGPSGWVLETEKHGWRITSCVLKKKQVSEVVKKVGGKRAKNSQR